MLTHIYICVYTGLLLVSLKLVSLFTCLLQSLVREIILYTFTHNMVDCCDIDPDLKFPSF